MYATEQHVLRRYSGPIYDSRRLIILKVSIQTFFSICPNSAKFLKIFPISTTQKIISNFRGLTITALIVT